MDENNNIFTNDTANTESAANETTSSTTTESSPFAPSTPLAGDTVKDEKSTTTDVYETANNAATNSVFSMGADNNSSSSTTKSAFDAGSGYSVPNNSYADSNTYNNTYNYAEPVSKTYAVVSLVLGIISILLSCCCCLGVVSGIVGIVFGILQKPEDGGKRPGMATAGIVTSAIGIAIYVILTIIGLVFQTELTDIMNSYY